MYKCVSFDFDRTIAYVTPLSHHIIPELLNKKGFNVTIEDFKKISEDLHTSPPEYLLDEYNRFGTMPNAERTRFSREYKVARVRALKLPGSESENNKIFQSVIEETYRIQKKVLYDDVQSTVVKLSQMEKQLYILSGNHSNLITEILDENQLLKHFKEIITVDKFSPVKEENFQVLLDHSNISPKEIVHIGDDVISDGLGAKKFNIDSIIIRRKSQLVYNNEQEDQFPVITNLSELFDYV
ncbi:MAG: HAD family hydrolase [Candidatus Heimdallarchaeota archaeon]